MVSTRSQGEQADTSKSCARAPRPPYQLRFTIHHHGNWMLPRDEGCGAQEAASRRAPNANTNTQGLRIASSYHDGVERKISTVPPASKIKTACFGSPTSARREFDG